jgi:pimeloyl-ACP methyl ester carboxylesterase
MTDAGTEVQFVGSSDGTAIAVERRGRGRPLVVVHGGLGARTSYAPVADLLADRLEFFLYDRRGRGASDWGDAEHSLQQEVDDLRAVVALAGPRAVVLGHSFGGAVVLEGLTGSIVPAGAVLYEPAVGFAVPDADALAAAPDGETLLVEGFRQLVENGGLREDERQSALAAKPSPAWDALVAAAPTLPREMAAVAAFEVDPDALAAVRVPTLVLLGDASGPRHRAICRSITRSLGNAELEVLPGQGHVAHLAAPDLIASSISRFVDRLP